MPDILNSGVAVHEVEGSNELWSTTSREPSSKGQCATNEEIG